MSFVNVGAKTEYETDGKVRLGRIATKKLLKTMLQNDIRSVLFDQTSMFPNNYGPDLLACDIREGDVLSVCGPDPYTDRKWYANVKIKDGKVIVT